MSSDEATANDAPEEQKEEAAEVTTEEEKPSKKKAPAAKKETKAMSKDDIVAAIKEMTVLELSELVKTLRSRGRCSRRPWRRGRRRD